MSEDLFLGIDKNGSKMFSSMISSRPEWYNEMKEFSPMGLEIAQQVCAVAAKICDRPPTNEEMSRHIAVKRAELGIDC